MKKKKKVEGRNKGQREVPQDKCIYYTIKVHIKTHTPTQGEQVEFYDGDGG
jgi:hypothetical protein